MQIVSKGLTYSYSEGSKQLETKALNDISLNVEEGDFFGIIGHTGSGKSTFIQHLNGLIRIGKNKGELKVGEYDLTDKKCKIKELRSKVGMVFQYPEYQLFAETVSQDVAYALKNFEKGLTEAQTEARVKEALELVGLDYDKVCNRSPFEFSGGQKRRIAIAGVLVAKPQVLVLDEPVAGLDPKGKKEFLELLRSLHQKFVKTIIIVTHDMNIVSEYCNKVAVFNNGKVEVCGTPKIVFDYIKDKDYLGLELPLTAYLTEKLKENGILIDNDYTEKDFIDKVYNLLNEGGKV